MINLEYIEELKKELRYDECYDYLMTFMEKEDPEAYYIYASWCHNGEVVDEDMSEAIKYYKLAINKGHDLARITLANYFYDLANYTLKIGIEYVENETIEDRRIALKLFRDAKAKYSLAMHYGHNDACDKYFEIFDLFDQYK